MTDLYSMINTWFAVIFFFSTTLLGFMWGELREIKKILQKTNQKEAE